MADLLLRRLRVLVEERAGRHDHSRRAEPALQAVLVPEGLLDRMKLPVLRNALDGRDLAAFELHGEQRAALRRLAVDEDGTRSALTRVAADVRPGQPEHVAQEMDEEEPWLHLTGEIDPVDVDADATHGASSRSGSRNARQDCASGSGSKRRSAGQHPAEKAGPRRRGLTPTIRRRDARVFPRLCASRAFWRLQTKDRTGSTVPPDGAL